jgi:8-oxo-dGTP pyrophosphatase MutT (NUDIX family)
MRKMVLGFMLDHKHEFVAMIRKPNSTKWNGIGGKVEDNESFHNAMVRECKEETGLDIPFWMYAGKMYKLGTMLDIHVFVTATDDVFKVLSQEEGVVHYQSVTSVIDNTLETTDHTPDLLKRSLACFYFARRIPFDIFVDW